MSIFAIKITSFKDKYHRIGSRTGVNMAAATTAKLVKTVDNIVGIKEASGNISQVAEIMNLTDGNIDLYSGNDDQIVPILSLGGIGVISIIVFLSLTSLLSTLPTFNDINNQVRYVCVCFFFL